MRAGIICVGAAARSGVMPSSAARLILELSKLGHDAAFTLLVPPDDGEIDAAIDYALRTVNFCVAVGSAFRSRLKNLVPELGSETCTVFDGVDFVIMESFDPAVFNEKIAPVLSAENKLAYETVVFRTFGLTEQEVAARLGNLMKNKSRISIRLIPEIMECAVHVRYSAKIAKMAVDEVLISVEQALRPHVYSFGDKSLAECAAEALTARGLLIAAAESFTGGGVTRALVEVPGAGNCVFAGVTAYSDRAKKELLDVESDIIKRFGSVSIETAYEMASGLLALTGADIAVATTGNAGPDAADGAGSRAVGECFIAVGNSSSVHVYIYRFKGGREEVMESGVKAALYRVLCLLRGKSE